MAANYGPVRNPVSDTASKQPHAGRGSAVRDRLIPVRNVRKIMRRVLPKHTNVSQDAKEAVQECASEFISFVIGEVTETCRKESRKIITGDDIIRAMNSLGFFNYAEVVCMYLQKCRMGKKTIESPIAKQGDASAVEKGTSMECLSMTEGEIGGTIECFAEEFAARFHEEILPMTVGEIGATNGYFGEEIGVDFDSQMQLFMQQRQPSIMDVQQSPYQLTMPSETDNSGNSEH